MTAAELKSRTYVALQAFLAYLVHEEVEAAGYTLALSSL